MKCVYIPMRACSGRRGFRLWVAWLLRPGGDGVIDIICGAFQAKLMAKNLSSGISRCISFHGESLTCCEIEHCAGRSTSSESTSRNWKVSIHFILFLFSLLCKPQKEYNEQITNKQTKHRN